jgi:hypothetical protein
MCAGASANGHEFGIAAPAELAHRIGRQAGTRHPGEKDN